MNCEYKYLIRHYARTAIIPGTSHVKYLFGPIRCVHEIEDSGDDYIVSEEMYKRGYEEFSGSKGLVLWVALSPYLWLNVYSDKTYCVKNYQNDVLETGYAKEMNILRVDDIEYCGFEKTITKCDYAFVPPGLIAYSKQRKEIFVNGTWVEWNKTVKPYVPMDKYEEMIKKDKGDFLVCTGDNSYAYYKKRGEK